LRHVLSPSIGSLDSIAEASTRFAVPASWIRAVMQVESGGDERATSPRGAIGLMQLMPGAWVELSVRYRFGLDPFDPSDNILAGTAYLKEMHVRFGSAGFLAAYHAGPW
jgi:soluble lytic murein transglycosylase-like protein